MELPKTDPLLHSFYCLESIPYDNHEHQVRAAMEELIDEEILSNKVVRVADEANPSAIEDLNVQVKQEILNQKLSIRYLI